MKHAWAAAGLALAFGIAPIAVHAQQYANTAKWVNLRAGPARTYPVVAVLAPQMQVVVYGCTSEYRWCDVTSGDQRGWVYAGNLLYPYQNSYAPVATIGAIVGIGILSFILEDYWHDYYRDRSWYGQRYRWVRPPLHPAPGVRPGPHVQPPPQVRPPPHVQPQPHGQPQPRSRPQPQRNDGNRN